ncbi:YbaN family protein [Idiomarina aquatica]|nr:YbaN family protein [Idiomarina aquatica]
MQWMTTVFWRCLALSFVALGFIGLLLPVMPTVPFLIVALWAASKGWPSLERKLLEHPKYGADIRAWRETRSVRRSAKWAAILMMTGGYIILWFIQWPPVWLKITVGVILVSVGSWLWTRPDLVETIKSNDHENTDA